MHDYLTNLSTIIAYSYIRFSHPDQAKGDSLRRQMEQAEAYCKRKGWTLDTSLSLRDLGVSAFRGKNALVGNLGLFIRAIEQGSILPGSVLIVESVDRISRQGIDEGYDLCKKILKAGVHIVTLSPERDFGPDAVKSLSKGALELQLILERAAEESERKSERIGSTWGHKKLLAREGHVMTKSTPAWIELKGGKLLLIPERAAAVRYLYELAVAGYGIPSIIQKLTAEGVPSFGRSGRWTRSYVALLLQDRRVLGEHIPTTRGVRESEAIIGYYPPVLESEEQWLAARGAVEERFSVYKGDPARRGRKAGARGRRTDPPAPRKREHTNIFVGILKNARDADNYIMTQRASRDRGKLLRKFSVLITSKGGEGVGQSCSYPYSPFEEAVLSLIAEIDPHEILNGKTGPDETLTIAGEVSRIESELSEATAYMDENGFSQAIAKRITALEAKLKSAGERLAVARRKAASPLSETWGEGKSLVAALKTSANPEDIRIRIRGVLRRIVSDMRLLVVPRLQDRIAALQILFHGSDKRREFVIVHRGASRTRSNQTWAGSLTRVATGKLDLCKKTDVRNLERTLEAIDVQVLIDSLEERPGKGV